MKGKFEFMIDLKLLLDVGFWERRAMEAFPVIVLTLIVGGTSAVYGYIVGKTRQHKGTKPNDEQNNKIKWCDNTEKKTVTTR